MNIAARLQAECPPGGICVSRSVHEHVHGRLGLGFEELGSLNLKNITRPVEAFVVRQVVAGERARSKEGRPHGDILPLPDRPSIAVLAFDNMSDDRDQEYFCDGIADDIITELSRQRQLFVTARNSSFTYRGRFVDVKQIGRELGVHYVVEGSVRRAGAKARIAVQLIDALTTNHIWAERYDREVADIFAVQGEIADAVATAIFPAVGEAEQRRAIRKPPSSLNAWETYQRAMWHFHKLTPAQNEQARILFEYAAKIDPGFASPLAGLSNTYLWDCMFYRTGAMADAVRRAKEAAQKAIAIDANDPGAQRALAGAFLTAGNYYAALDCVDRALALNRNSAGAYRIKGGALVLMGRYSDGRAEAQTSLRLNPRDPLGGVAAGLIAVSHYLEGNYESTVDTVERSLTQYSQIDWSRWYLVAALGQLGRKEDASAALGDMRTVVLEIPNLTNRPNYMRPEHYDHLLEGLRKAGWDG